MAEAQRADDPQAVRRSEILDAGLRVLVRDGWARTSMNAIAKEAHASKETLYNWFGDRRGFFAALVRHTAQNALGAVDADPSEMTAWLEATGQRVLQLLLGDTSIAINRAAIASVQEGGELAAILIEEGRGKAMRQVAAQIALWAVEGRLHVPEGADLAADDWLGLLKGDVQLLALLGQGKPLSAPEIETRARRAAQQFLRLYAA